jgi:hypothetical protein
MTFEISGRTLTMSVEWRGIGGPQPFRWFSSVTWTRASGSPHVAFDSVPQSGFARWPK